MLGDTVTLRKTWRLSERIGLLPTLGCTVAWLALGTACALGVAEAFSPYPKLALVLAMTTALVVAFGGLVCFWMIASHIEFYRRGYRVRWVEGDNWLYEERQSKGGTQFLPCVRTILGKGYPAPSEVHLPGEGAWNAGVPPWAQNRRAEIVQRIGRCFGADIGGRITFVESRSVA